MHFPLKTKKNQADFAYKSYLQQVKTLCLTPEQHNQEIVEQQKFISK